MRGTGRRAVAIGGGTGLPMVLRCLIEQEYETSAVVTMADDGGSSGRLRRELGILPPGDVRNCLVAMAEDSALASVFQYRFQEGEGLTGHSLGNLIIAALEDIADDFPSAIRIASELLGSKGNVYPCTLDDVHLAASDASGNSLRGQARIARTIGPMARVCLEPDTARPNGEAVDAIRQADAIIVGPGSLYTSLIPNFLVPGITESVREAHATKIYVCNLANQRGETSGMDAAAHVQALVDHGLSGVFDVVLVHEGGEWPLRPGGAGLCEDGHEIEPVAAGAEVCARIEEMGTRVVTADLIDHERQWRHDPDKLCRQLCEVL